MGFLLSLQRLSLAMVQSDWFFSSSLSGLSGLRRLDAYPKTLEDFRVQTRLGGGLTLAAVALCLGLFALETRAFLEGQLKEELLVDTARGNRKLSIHFDVVVHRISCPYLSLDAMDVSGEQHIGIEHNVFKTRLNLDGKPIDEPQKERHIGESGEKNGQARGGKNNTLGPEDGTEQTTSASGQKSESECGSCYGAESESQPCCNTCDQVREAYSRKTWKFDPRGVSQCASGADSEQEKNALLEGCHLFGDLEVNRVAGSFHIGPGTSFSVNHVHVHDVQPFASTDFNLTHTIRHLSFGSKVGDPSDSSEEPPLNGVKGDADKGATMFQYYLKIVPTTYARSDGSLFLTNQYSVTRHQKVVSVLSGESGMPGVFFQYELAPFMVKLSHQEKSWGHFLSSLCAIIGGVVTVAGIVDKLVYKSSNLLKKLDLGKLT